MIFVADIQRVTAAHFEIPAREMVSARRSREVARPRQVAMYLAREMTPQSLPAIGRMFGGRDHTTVLHAIRTIGSLNEVSPKIRESVNAIKEQVLAENSQKQADLQGSYYGVELAA
jgi:chromosomal replication initiator protein